MPRTDIYRICISIYEVTKLNLAYCRCLVNIIAGIVSARSMNLYDIVTKFHGKELYVQIPRRQLFFGTWRSPKGPQCGWPPPSRRIFLGRNRSPLATARRGSRAGTVREWNVVPILSRRGRRRCGVAFRCFSSTGAMTAIPAPDCG